MVYSNTYLCTLWSQQFLARQRLVVQCVVVTAKVLGTHPAVDSVLGLLQRHHALVLRTLVGLAWLG